MSDQSALREEFRDWLSEHQRGEFVRYSTEPMVGTRLVPPEVSIAWERELATGRWVGITIPQEFGGRGLSIDAELAFFEEYARSRAMPRLPTIGESLLAPTLLAAGSLELQQRFLPPIVAATELWCQGYSEPDAGSDLASLRTKATLDGDHWVISGQKVWTTWAHLADWCFVLARTGEPEARHRALTYLIVPMDQPGIEVRPINQATGETEYCEVFFDGAVDRRRQHRGDGRPGMGRRHGDVGLRAWNRGHRHAVVLRARVRGSFGPGPFARFPAAIRSYATR